MDLIITPEEVGALSRPISQHIDHAQISAYITEVEQLIIRPALGDYLFGEVKNNAVYYHILIHGGKDAYGNICGGLRKAVAYYTYARIIKQGATIPTRFGAVEKTDEHSVRMEQERKDNIFRECSNIADAYMMEVVKYAKARGWTQASKASVIRRTAFVIGDESQAQECVAPTPSSGGGGGGGTTEGGEIYAGEGINIRDNVISVNMTEVRAGVGIPTIEENIASIAEDVEQLKNQGGSGGTDITVGEGLVRDGSIVSVDFEKVASTEGLKSVQGIADNANKLANDANKLANDANNLASTANTKADSALTTAQNVNTALAGKADKSELSNYATTEALAQKADASALSDKADKSALENYATKEQLDNYATKEEVKQMTATTASIAPNILHVWGEVAELNITLADGEEGVVDEYMVQFTSGATATTLTLPESIVWMSAPNIQANKIYQISIINNLGVIGEFSNG